MGFLNQDDRLGRRLVSGAWWLAVGGAISNGSTLIGSVLVARLLGVTSFGHYTILVSTLGVVMMLAGPSIGWTSSKYVAEFRQSDPRKAARIIALTHLVAIAFSLLFALVLIIGARAITQDVLKVPEIRVDLIVASVAVLFNGINGAQRGTLGGFQQFRTVALVNAAQGVTLVSLFLLLVGPYGIMGAVVAQGCAAMVSCLVGSVAIQAQMRRARMPRFAFPQKRDLAVFGGFTVPTYLISISAIASSWFVGVLVVRSPNGSFEMGIYGIATQVFLTCMFLPTMLAQPCVPILSQELRHGRERGAAIRRLMLFMVSATFFIAVLIGGGLLAFGDSVLAIFAKGLDHYYSLLVLTVLTAVVASSAGPLNYYMAARGDMWLALVLNCFGVAANVAVVFVLRESGAAAGAVWGRFIYYIGVFPFLVAYAVVTMKGGRVIGTRNPEMHAEVA